VIGPAVTVLMGVYNGELFVRDAIDSILAQSYRDFELLVVDDGSTDTTPAILASYDDSRLRVLRNEENIGLTRSLNRGLRAARGGLIARQDADDLSLPNRLARQVTFLESHPDVVLLGTQFVSLGAWRHRPGTRAEVLVYPDLPAARRLAADVRRGRFRDDGLRRLGPLGLGTEFESVRDYSPDDDVRQVNWRATARLGRPMSNQYRVERDRDVICVVDCGRLMAAPFADRTRLDSALDAAVAVAAVADVLGDRCGGIAFDAEVRRSLPPRRAGALDLVHAFYDLEPRPVESDYELAFQRVGGAKRALVLVFTDLLEESAARPLVDALPVLARRHAVAVASAADSDLETMIRTEPYRPGDVYRAAVALDVLAARERVAVELRRAGAVVIEAGPQQLGAACVKAYLRAKSVARF